VLLLHDTVRRLVILNAYVCLCVLYMYPPPLPQPFYGPFSWTTRVSRCEKKAFSGLYGAWEDNKMQTHQQSAWVPLHVDQSAFHLHQSPAFLRWTPSCCNPPNLPWLGTGIGVRWIAYPGDLVVLYMYHYY